MSKDLVAALDRDLRGRGEEITELLGQLIRARTFNPPGNEREAADVAGTYLDKHGIDHSLHEKEPRRANLLARIGPGTPGLVLVCHLDTVPAGPGWTVEPFEPTVREGRVYGRGATDNKGAAAAALVALAALRRHDVPLVSDVVVGLVADEELGSALGVSYLLDEDILKARWGVVADSLNSMRNVYVSEKGLLQMRVTAKGVQAHGSTPELGHNAIDDMVRLLTEVRGIDLDGPASELHTPTTLNTGRIEGGEAVNMVAASCRAALDVRYVPGQSHEEIIARVKETMERVSGEVEGAQFSLETLCHLVPVQVPADSALVEAVREEAGAVMGERPGLGGLSGTTVMKQFLWKGIEIVAFGPGPAHVPHTADEWISVSELVQFARAFARIALRLAGKGGDERR